MLNGQLISLNSNMTNLTNHTCAQRILKSALELIPPKVDQDLKTHLEYI